ncbi:F-box/LRR-repeat protein 15-like isoform X2 [Asparagus officinalis]|nr:F-box/LRR-repeat protein 15-like isoform X2 [Asparagus officinalis]XP_020256792.1 F-box/LRR-repeat protein 15-like isoform X2 [Asparagus officinalis]XP_020256793.1 F-box/LRR-repeat protein 15-like isoform X2 [Asparagus officinalis]
MAAKCHQKEMVDVDTEVEEEKEVSEDEAESLELELSLGRWGSVAGSPSNPARSMERWLGSFDLTVGSSSLVETFMCRSELRNVLQTSLEAGIKHADSGLDGCRDYKRPKVLGFTPTMHHTSSGNEASVPPASGDHVNSQASLFPSDTGSSWKCRDQDDGGGKMSMNSNAGGDDDENEPSASKAEDIEIRMDLTEDLLHLVFSFLSLKDLCKAGATCKQWQIASVHEDFWRCLNFEDTGISQNNFEAICHRYPNANEVNLSGVYNSDMLAMEAMASLRLLETLTLGKGQLGDNFFHALTDCPALNKLSICDASLGNGIQEIAIYHDRLRELDILKCRVLRISVRCPQLQTLSLRRTSMAHVVLICPQLHELDLSSCHKLSDAGIRSAATSCPLLASLDMSSCSCVSDETLREIAFACPNLCVLDASYCPNVALEAVRLPMLIDLKLHSCEGITSTSMSAVSYSRMLESLQLVNCGLLTSVSLDLPHLRNISLVHCRKFVDLDLRSSVLSCIKVSNCSALIRINITSHALQKLVLQKQESLSTLLLQCPNLQEVDLSDCESLTNAICEVFSNGGGCSLLRTLVLDNCESLTAVGLTSSSLVNLSLVGCRAMTVLDLSCPNLLTVNLDGCDHLERASFCPVGLESLNLGICPKLSALRIEAPKMAVLELKGCGILAQASLSCPSLMSLDASFCRQLLDDSLARASASCPLIKSLVLSSCLSIGVAGLSSLRSLKYLILLDLSYTFLTNLQPVFDSCPQLTILKLSACKFLTDSSLDALYKEGALPALCELDLSYSSIGQSAILGLLACCANLVNVNLNGCSNMHDLVWCSSDSHHSDMAVDIYPSNSVFMGSEEQVFRKTDHLLEILNCIGCPNIKKVAITSSACCFHLSKLNLNLSANLKEVDLACFNLNSLNLSNCCSLEILKLDCPRLTNLQLLACTILSEEAVEVAISRCKMLETLNIHSCPKIHAACLDKLRVVCPRLKRIQGSLTA